jgi:hypothetical protein
MVIEHGLVLDHFGYENSQYSTLAVWTLLHVSLKHILINLTSFMGATKSMRISKMGFSFKYNKVIKQEKKMRPFSLHDISLLNSFTYTTKACAEKYTINYYKIMLSKYSKSKHILVITQIA